MSIDFRADLEGILIEGIATVRPMPTICAAARCAQLMLARVRR
jgi:hypothetical protein